LRLDHHWGGRKIKGNTKYISIFHIKQALFVKLIGLPPSSFPTSGS